MTSEQQNTLISFAQQRDELIAAVTVAQQNLDLVKKELSDSNELNIHTLDKVNAYKKELTELAATYQLRIDLLNQKLDSKLIEVRHTDAQLSVLNQAVVSSKELLQIITSETDLMKKLVVETRDTITGLSQETKEAQMISKEYAGQMKEWSDALKVSVTSSLSEMLLNENRQNEREHQLLLREAGINNREAVLIARENNENAKKLNEQTV